MATTNQPANSIQNFIGNFKGGLRPNRFLVTGEIPGDDGVDEQFAFHVRSASVPASDLTQIGVPFRGREFKIPGNRTYATWQMAILDDSAFNVLWTKFHRWSNRINSHRENAPKNPTTGADLTSGIIDFTDYMKTWSVRQLDINGSCVRKVDLIRCWPSVIGEVSFLMDDNESFCTFTVDLEYQYFQEAVCDADLEDNGVQDKNKIVKGINNGFA